MQRFLKYHQMIIAGLLLLVWGCNSGNENTGKISPQEGAEGDMLTIVGDYSDVSPEELSINFSDIKATVHKIDSNQLVVEVPKGLPEGKALISIKTRDQVIENNIKFKVYKPDFYSDNPYPINLIYFSSPDNPPLPNYEERFSTIMLEVEDFFNTWMKHWGYDQTIGILKDKRYQRVKITHIISKHSYKEYPYKGGGQRVIKEIDEYFREHPKEKNGEHTFVILPRWPGQDEGGPFYGLGRIAFAADNDYMDVKNFEDPEMADGATKYIGGLVHELGHSLNLPHNRQTLSEDKEFGMALMSGGNFTYGQKPTFVTKASAAILSKAQPFAKSEGAFYGPVKAQLKRISGQESDGKIIIEGEYTADHPVSSVIVYNYNPENEYHSVPMVTTPEGNSRFRAEIPADEIRENKKHEYHVAIKFVFENGSAVDVAGPGYKIADGVAEIDFDYSDKDEFKSFPRENWRIIDVSSEERGEGYAKHVLDGDYHTFWHSRWSHDAEDFPHSLTIDMGEQKEVEGFSFVQREFGRRIKDFTIEMSNDQKNWKKLGDYELISVPFPQLIRLEQKKKFRYFRLTSYSAWDGAGHSSMAEIGAF